jgi:hypothetical protein
MASFEDIVFFYLVGIEGDNELFHKEALIFPAKNVLDDSIGAHLEIWQAPKSKRWHWRLQYHTVHTYFEDPGEGFIDAKAAMKAAMEHGEVATTIGSWMDGERLEQIAGYAQEERERKKERGL